jgi:ABC-type branched-subunit amino acid transport system ATPase component
MLLVEQNAAAMKVASYGSIVETGRIVIDGPPPGG